MLLLSALDRARRWWPGGGGSSPPGLGARANHFELVGERMYVARARMDRTTLSNSHRERVHVVGALVVGAHHVRPQRVLHLRQTRVLR